METARQSQKSVKLMRKYAFRHEFRYFLIKYGRGLRPLPKEGGGLRPPPSFGSIFDEKGSESVPEGTFRTYFDPFSMFSDEHRSRRFLRSPENPKINDFDRFGTSRIGHPEHQKTMLLTIVGHFQSGIRNPLKSFISAVSMVFWVSRSLSR